VRDFSGFSFSWQGKFRSRRRHRYGGRTYVKVARHFRRCVECQDISQATGRLCGDGQRLAFAPWGRRR